MNNEHIIEIIRNYDELVKHTENIIKIIETLDREMYSTGRDIEKIEFEGNDVSVRCDDSCRGCYDYFYFSFPISFLSMSEEELINKVTQEREERNKKKEEEKLNKEKEERLKKEKSEKELYEKLKMKFENNG